MDSPRKGILVRDKIPQLMQDAGMPGESRTAGQEEYVLRLRELLEACARIPASVSARVDVLEVVYALGVASGHSPEALEALRADKADKRGTFTEMIIWVGNEPGGDQ